MMRRGLVMDFAIASAMTAVGAQATFEPPHP